MILLGQNQRKTKNNADSHGIAVQDAQVNLDLLPQPMGGADGREEPWLSFMLPAEISLLTFSL